MKFAYWLSLAAFIAVALSALEVALGWRRIRHLKDVMVPPSSPQPRVSLIVSALDEAATIEPALHSLLAIDYPDLEIIVINDRSTDATPAIIEQVAAGAARMRVVHVRDLPPGWLGKNHALHQGAAIATGDYLLFTDADAVFAPSAVARAVAHSRAHGVDHLTLFFDLQARSSLLRLLVISFGAGFMARFKPWKVATSPRHYVGIGGFNLLRRSAYEGIGGHAAMPLAVLDDMELGRRIKAGGYTQHAMSGVGMVAIEWYRSTPDLVRGLEKNVFSGFDYRLATLVGVTLLMLITRVWPWLALLTTRGPVWWFNLGTVCATLALYVDLLHARKWPMRCLVFAPIVPFIEIATWWRACLLAVFRGGIAWRGTHYRLADLRQAHRATAGRGKDSGHA
jgi:cellulose synthase/poly-beta-1,6-N-acetylglucosamine synthase-like glycosyltransferase